MQFISENNIKDYITLDNDIFTHKQIEVRNGITFMRMKKRILRKETS